MTFINEFKYLGENSLISGKYSLHLNELLQASCPPPFGPAELFKFVPDELVRKNLAASANSSLRCSTTYIPVGDLDRSPLIREPLNKSYGDHWLTAQFGIKAPLRRHAVACQEVAPKVGALGDASPNCAVSPGGRVLRHAAAALQPSPRAMAIAFGLRLASTCLRARRDPIGLVQRFLSYGYASAGDQSTLFAIFPLYFVPFMQYAG